MIRPTKHSDPRKTALPVAGIILQRLRRYRTESLAELRHFVRKKSLDADVLFVPAVDLLFLLGLVEYHPKTDSFEYVGP